MRDAVASDAVPSMPSMVTTQRLVRRRLTADSAGGVGRRALPPRDLSSLCGRNLSLGDSAASPESGATIESVIEYPLWDRFPGLRTWGQTSQLLLRLACTLLSKRSVPRSQSRCVPNRNG